VSLLVVGVTGVVLVASGGRVRCSAGGGVPAQNCQATSTATDSAIAISERFSILFTPSPPPQLPSLRQCTPHHTDELVKGTAKGGRAGDEAEPDSVGWHEPSLPAVGFPQPPPSAVPHYATTQSAANSKAHRPRSGLSAPQQHECGALHARPTPEESLELCSGPEPLRPRQSRGGRSGHPVQPVNRRRPLARRRFSTFRPPFVDIRSRNPCVLARRRRFGWNVRFTYILLVRVLRTARSSYRPGADPVKRCAAASWPNRGCRPKDPRAMVGRSVRRRGAHMRQRRCAQWPKEPRGESSASGDDGRAPGVIHRRG
jgi:hypothetical protein